MLGQVGDLRPKALRITRDRAGENPEAEARVRIGRSVDPCFRGGPLMGEPEL
jgi:hypothetical protein